MKIIAIVLIVIGLGGLAYGGFSFTRKDKVVDLGPVEITQDKTESFPVTPVASVALLVAGAALLVVNSKGLRAA